MRWRRARIIEAESERQAAAIMTEAAAFYEKRPVAVRLRELQTLIEIAREKNVVVVTPTMLGINMGLLMDISRDGVAQAIQKSEKWPFHVYGVL